MDLSVQTASAISDPLDILQLSLSQRKASVRPRGMETTVTLLSLGLYSESSRCRGCITWFYIEVTEWWKNSFLFHLYDGFLPLWSLNVRNKETLVLWLGDWHRNTFTVSNNCPLSKSISRQRLAGWAPRSVIRKPAHPPKPDFGALLIWSLREMDISPT